MENQLQRNNTLQKPIVLTTEQMKFAKIIYHVNQLTPYPLTGVQIEDWAKTLADLYRGLDLEVLKDIIKEMKLDNLEWNPKQGIQNLTRALKQKGINDFYTQNEIDKINAEYNI